MTKSLWIIGMRGAGKSTTGRAVAEAMGWKFFDCDAEIERRLGSTILDYVDREGLKAFRKEEEAQLRGFVSIKVEGLVVSCGGGFVDWEPSRRIVLESAWPKLWLDVPAERLWERLQNAPERQKIGNLTSLEALRDLTEKRARHFAKIATLRSDSQDISECLALIRSSFSGG